MKKLEDIPKNHPFKVPEGYFDHLPGVIQARTAEKSPIREAKPYVRYALQYALPAVAIALAVVFYLAPNPRDMDSMLASVSTEELAAYLEESEITTDELLDEMDLDIETVDAIEEEVYLNFEGIENLDETDLDLNNL